MDSEGMVGYSIITIDNVSDTTNGNITNIAKDMQNCLIYEVIMYTIICGLLCIFGISGNITAFIVFQKDTLKTSTTFLFQALSLTDTLLLVTVFPTYCLGPIMMYFEVPVFELLIKPYISVYVYQWAQIAQTAVVWVTVLVGVNRYIAVCIPYKASRLCSVAKARKYLAVVLFFSFVYNIPHFVTRKIVYITATNNESLPDAQSTENPVFNIIYYNICYLIFMALAPLTILTVLSFKLIRTLKKLKRRRAEMQTRQQQQDNNVTFVLIIVLLVFTVCQAPALVTQILWSTLPDSQRECGGFQFYWSRISNTLVVLNSAVNFVIYFEFNKRFRQVIFLQVCKNSSDKYKHTENGTHEQDLITRV